ncbi:hypothetical protein FACS1894109_10600 [Spirochaetia bacterium]|nr:hypothetical protein FACS1894109_10600 [Spirochaetia bacterium]
MKIKYGLIFLFPLLVCSCVLTEQDLPPYVISRPVCLTGSKPGYFTFAGIEFDFSNVSGKNISGISLSFMVYDADTKKNPLIGSNTIKMSFEGLVKPQELKKFFISLDQYIYTAPDKAYLIDFFCITKIIYEDGSRWEDPGFLYYTGTYQQGVTK